MHLSCRDTHDEAEAGVSACIHPACHVIDSSFRDTCWRKALLEAWLSKEVKKSMRAEQYRRKSLVTSRQLTQGVHA